MMSKQLPILDKKKFGCRLKELRTAAGYTQKQCFDLIRNDNTSDAKTFRSWELGKTLPSLDDLFSICTLFGCDADYLLGFQDHPKGKIIKASKETGLSYSAIEKIQSIVEHEKKNPDSDVISSRFSILLDSMQCPNCSITFKGNEYDIHNDDDFSKLILEMSPFLHNLNSFLLSDVCPAILSNINLFTTFQSDNRMISGTSDGIPAFLPAKDIESVALLNIIRLLQSQKEQNTRTLSSDSNDISNP